MVVWAPGRVYMIWRTGKFLGSGGIQTLDRLELQFGSLTDRADVLDVTYCRPT